MLDASENYILVAPHRTFGIQFTWHLQHVLSSLFLWLKELFANRLFAWWIKMCGAFPIDRDKPSPDAIRYPVNMLKRAIVLFLCFQVEVGIRKRSKEGRCDC